MNPAKLLKIKSSWDEFTKKHSKFPQFLGAVNNSGLEEGTVIEINVITAAGKNISTNLKITASDREMFQELSELMKPPV